MSKKECTCGECDFCRRQMFNDEMQAVHDREMGYTS